MTDRVILALPFLFGAVVGSFLNVCIHRIPAGLSIVRPSSRCPVCRRPIPFYYNIPILSYIILGGRCRYCRAPISARYPLVEALAGAAAVGVYMRFGPGVEAIVYFAFNAALIVVTFIDLDKRIIPDVVSLPGIALGLVASFFLPSPGVAGSVAGIVTGGGFLLAVAAGYFFITRRSGMGGGDIKLLAMIGAFLGWRGVFFTIFAASMTGAVVGLAAMVISGKGGRYALPFGPFLALGAVFYLFYGEAVISWYLSRLSGGI